MNEVIFNNLGMVLARWLIEIFQMLLGKIKCYLQLI